jgi:drug/metabolite transporter (DMT)-like permease
MSLIVMLLQQLRSTAPTLLRRNVLVASCGLGVIGEAANVLSTWGLSKLPAVLSETLLGCVHVFVPLQTVMFLSGSQLGARTAGACILSFISVATAAALSRGTSEAASAAHQMEAPILAPVSLIAAAWFYGLQRVRLQALLQRGYESTELAFCRILWMSVLGVIMASFDALRGGPTRSTISHAGAISHAQWIWLVASCLLSGIGGSLLQYSAQATLPAANAQPFYALQPLFAAMWSWLLLDEPLQPSLIAAATLSIGATLLASTDGHSAKLATRHSELPVRRTEEPWPAPTPKAHRYE